MDVNYIDWHVTPFRADRWLEIWRPALDRALAFGARSCFLTRNEDDPLHFRQVSYWESHDDFDRYWASDEISALREAALQYFHKPIYPIWHTLTAEGTAVAGTSDEVAVDETPPPTSSETTPPEASPSAPSPAG